MRGGEKVIEKLLEIYPGATIITHVYDPESVSDCIRSSEVRETFIGALPGARKHYKKYLPLMPRALEQVDMQEFDLIISSESGPAKGIIPRPDATHVCYCHSPMRYIWDHYHIYKNSAGWLYKMAMPYMAHRLRSWDVTSAARVDHFIANSHFVAQRIKKFYRRDAEVIAPPVSVDDFSISESVGDHYLLAGELVSYKRPEIAIQAFNASGRKLVVVGDGEMREQLERMAKPNILFQGRVSFPRLKEEFSKCRALVFPGEEDFGIVPVEIMASGRPVIALKRGGALDYVIPGKTGEFFETSTAEDLNAAVDRLETNPDVITGPQEIRDFAQKFHGDLFKARIKASIDTAISAQSQKLAG